MKTHKIIIISLLFFILLSGQIIFAQLPTYNWSFNPSSSTHDMWGYSVTIDGSGNILTTGEFRGSADFDPSGGTTTLTSVAFEDIYVAKYDVNGNYIWAFSLPGTRHDHSYKITTDASDNIYIVGSFEQTIDFDPGVATVNRIANGQNDAFIAKYDSNGNYLWNISIGSNNDDEAKDIAIDASGNIYITGNFSGTMDIDPSGTIYNLTSFGQSDVFVIKYDVTGNLIWGFGLGAGQYDYGEGICTNSSGDVIITGQFDNTVDFDPNGGSANLTGSSNIFVAKYNSSGAYQWAFGIGDNSSSDIGTAISTDLANNIYVIGGFDNMADFDPSSNIVNLASNGNRDVFLAKYNNAGNYQSAFNIGSSSNDIGNDISISDSLIYITGYFKNTADFDPSNATANLTAANQTDIFVSSYDTSMNYQWAYNMNDDSYGYGQGITSSCEKIHITGKFKGIADFDPSSGIANLTPNSGYDFYLASYNSSTCNSSLPIKLLHFYAINENHKKVRCEWSTATEINNNYFSVQRSQDGINFEQIGTVQGAENSSATLNYVFYDERPYSQVSYYRLKQVDFNNEFSYSVIRSVYLDPFNIINIYPNPAEGSINILVGTPDDMDVCITVFNNIGQKIIDLKKNVTTGYHTINLNTSSLRPGNYIFKITTSTGEHYKKEFIKK
jgi:hypothetical protein